MNGTTAGLERVFLRPWPSNHVARCEISRPKTVRHGRSAFTLEGTFGVLRRGYEYWVDTPANRHGQAANLSYADGHASLRRCRWPKFCSEGEYLYAPRDGPNGRDAHDLHELQACIPQ